jgi:AraC-like DNA-binding protein
MLTTNYHEIWKEYGYRSQSTFLKNFHRVFNMSPDEFIKKYKTTQPHKEPFPNELYLHLKELVAQYTID